MRAVQFSPEVGFAMETVEVPAVNPDEVRLQVDACGVCGSDRQVVQGEAAPIGTPFPCTMGHEIAGTILEVGDRVSGFQVGDLVVVHPFLACGTCAPCQHGQPNLCIRQVCIGYQRAGGFAEQVVVPASLLIRRPPRCSAVAACLLVDAYATPFHALTQSGMQAGDTALVIGTGGLGLAALQLARVLETAHVGAVTRRDASDEIPARFGAEIVVSIEKEARAAARSLRRWAGSGGIDVVLDTVVTEETVAFALDVVRPGGSIMCIGLSDEKVNLPINKAVRKGIRLLTGYGSLIEDVKTLMDWTEVGKLDPSVLVADTLRLDQVERAFANVRTSGRFVIEPNRQTTKNEERR